MRILHIDLGRELRGGQHQVLLLLKTLQDAGHTGTLLARKGSPLFEKAHLQGFLTVPASLWTLGRLSSACDLVHAHDAGAHTWAAISARKPFVVSRRVAFPISRWPLSKLKYRRAARYLAVSKYVFEKLRCAGVPEAKIDVVWDAVETSDIIPEWHRDAPVVALDSLDPQKGRDLIERASQIARIPITFSSDLPSDLARASAFVYISRSEGFGSAALLAMKMGVPLIASHIDGMAEVFEEGRSGIAAGNDPASIAAAIQRLLSQPELAKSLIKNAHDRVTTLFNPSRLLTATLTSYRSALAR